MQHKWRGAIPFLALFLSFLAVLALYDWHASRRTAKLVRSTGWVNQRYSHA
jgi:hypothetical protein